MTVADMTRSLIGQQYLEVRRHAARNKPGPNLSQEGIVRALASGATQRKFARVVTSTDICAVQTAVAMGHAVDEEDPWLSSLGQVVSAQIEWDAGFVGFAEAIRRGGAVALYADLQARLWRQILTEIGPGDSALIITHGGIVESGTIGTIPHVDLSGAGRELGYCEGVGITYQDGMCAEVRIYRFDGDCEVEDRVFHFLPEHHRPDAFRLGH
jgi:broad specificity phosphatase PhoE